MYEKESELHQLTMEERDRRYKKIRELMRKQGFDALIMAGGDGVGVSYGNAGDIRYISLVDVNNSWNFAVFPLEGEPSMIVRVSPADVRNLGWVTDVKGVKKLEKEMAPIGLYADEQYPELLVDTVKKLKLSESTIGLVKYDKFPLSIYNSLVKAFPKATFKNGTELMREVRMIKSPEELRLVIRTGELADIAAQTCIETVRPGVTHGKVAAAQHQAMALHEMEHFYSGYGKHARANEVFKSGDLFNTEGYIHELAARGGYWNHTPHRTISLGEPSRAYRDAYEKACDVFKVMANATRPGNTVADVCKAVIGAGGLPWGHGHGLDMCERPWISESEPLFGGIEIKPGMVIALQPAVTVKGVYATVWVVVVVYETGARALSKIPLDLIVVK